MGGNVRIEGKVATGFGVTFLAAMTLGSISTPAAQAGAGAVAPLHWQVISLPHPANGAPFSYAEPGIAIADDGTALVDAATANTGGPATVWVSRDAGISWASGVDFDSTAPSTGDADVAIGANGDLYALDLGYSATPPAQPTNPTVLVYRTHDGRVWQGPAAFPVPHGFEQPDRPWLVVDPHNPADVDVVNSEGGGNVVMWRSTDHAASFVGPIAVTGGANSEAALALSSRPLFDPADDRHIYMLYETGTPTGRDVSGGAGSPLYEFPMTQLWLAASTDAGATWSSHEVFDTATAAGSTLQAGTLAHLLVASAVDAVGNLYAAVSLRANGQTATHIYFIHSADGGISWSRPMQVDTNTQSNVMPALTVSPAGAAYLSWYGSASADFRDRGAEWAELFAQSSDPLSQRPAFVVTKISGPQPVHVGGIDTAGTIGADLGANWGLRDFQSIAVDGCGRPHPVWAVDRGAPSTETAVPSMPCPILPAKPASPVISSTGTAAAAPPGIPNTSSSPPSAAVPTAAPVAVGGLAALGLTARARQRRRALT